MPDCLASDHTPPRCCKCLPPVKARVPKSRQHHARFLFAHFVFFRFGLIAFFLSVYLLFCPVDRRHSVQLTRQKRPYARTGRTCDRLEKPRRFSSSGCRKRTGLNSQQMHHELQSVHRVHIHLISIVHAANSKACGGEEGQ